MLTAQSFDNLCFGTDNTFEVVTWNIERFPKNGQTTVDQVIQIIKALDVDLLAIQEVDDSIVFHQMVDQLPGYEGYLESSYFAGLAYIYKSAVVKVNGFQEIYTSSPYWKPFPRSPMVLDMHVRNQQIFIINNHYKCCGNGILDPEDPDDEENRRLRASNLLKDFIDTYASESNVIMLGDLNDILTDDPANNVFQMFLDDPDHYRFADMAIAEGPAGDWSYPAWPSHLDHILITDELFEKFDQESTSIESIKLEEYYESGWTAYENSVSDHRPVGLRMVLDPTMEIQENSLLSEHFTVYPNPMRTSATFAFDAAGEGPILEIFSAVGKQVYAVHLSPGQTTINWNSEHLPEGIYFARLLQEKVLQSSIKLIISR
jgi:endonuclease/exonuclease/phosphatase family metal-dependent hydrolase